MKLSRLFVLSIFILAAYAVNSSAQWKRGPVGLGVNVGVQQYVGDWDPGLGGMADFVLRASIVDFLGVSFHTGYGLLNYRNSAPAFRTNLMNAELRANVLLLPHRRLSPLVYIGGGGFFYEVLDENKNTLRRGDGDTYKGWDGIGFVGGGLDFLLGSKWSFSVTGDYHFTTSDGIDGNSAGSAGDGYFSVRAGLMFNIGGEHDSDGDGIFDGNDADKRAPEDFDGFRDEDGKPDYDNDNDGIADSEDKAPLLPEDHDGFSDEDGVPDPDNDNDGIPDFKDAAPNDAEDRDGWNDDDGAPDVDNDGDGIADARDGAINIPEDKDGYQDDDGVPDFDNDADQIPDSLDVSPNLPENYNGFEDFDGAPDERPFIMKDETITLKGVSFRTGSATLATASYPALDELWTFLRQNPDARVEIHGHTDSQGDEQVNMRLSYQRAASVRDFLVARGISADRIVALGFGETKPIADNYYAETRSANRRIDVLRTQ
jgi:outer membrane protein OmpA-like peptidoglycan-associated protein